MVLVNDVIKCELQDVTFEEIDLENEDGNVSTIPREEQGRLIAALLGPRGPQPIAAYLAQFPKEERDKWSPSVAVMRRALGCEHLGVLTAMLDIGEVRCKLGRYSEGLALMREATVAMWRVHGEGHWDTTNAVDKMKEQQRQAAVVRKEAAQSRRRGGVVSAVEVETP